MAKVEQPSGGRVISKEEVAKHNKEGDLWFIIHGKVYDVSKFAEEHPGGVDILMERAGLDATTSFEDVGHSVEARKQLAKLYIGEAEGGDSAKPAASPAPASSASTDSASSGGSGLGRFAIPVIIVVVAVALGLRFFRS